jgi:hypothetical protein
VLGAIHGFSQGGARGITSGIGSVAGAAAALDPEPISKAVLGGVALVSGLVSSFLGDPVQMRQNFINKTLERQQFYTPAPINVSETTGGGAAAYDRRGNVFGSSVSPFPVTQQPYYDFRNHVLVPGRDLSNVGGPGGNTNVYISAMDTQSMKDAFTRHSDAVADGFRHAVENNGRNDVISTLRERL